MAAIDQRTYYDLLNVSKTATKAEIKKSYYALSRILHPDKCPDNPNAEEMVLIENYFAIIFKINFLFFCQQLR